MDEETDGRGSDSSELNEGRCLILMRHAKSDWGDESLPDHERPLNERGRRDAPRMAQWLAEQTWVPDVVLSSSSVRTRETLQLMSDTWDDEPTQSFTRSLYLASPEAILDCIRADGNDAPQLMVLAHNPGISYVASLLADQSVEMPTAAAAVFRVDLDHWYDLRPSTPIQLVEFMRPKALDA